MSERERRPGGTNRGRGPARGEARGEMAGEATPVPGAAPDMDGPGPIVYLDVDDEITSAAARIRASGGGQVTLVLPYGSRLATSRINFRLLAREAAEREKQLEIVTADASARALAASAGLPVHPSVAAWEAARAGAGTTDGNGDAGVAEAAPPAPLVPPPDAPGPVPDAGDDSPTRVLAVPRRRPAEVPRVGPPRPPVRTGLAVGIGLALVVLVAAGALLALELLPSATIVLSPRAEPIAPMSLSVEARTDTAAADPEGLRIPAQRVEFDLAASTTISATGVKVTETKATGNVTFSNLDPFGSKRIEAGSIVSTKSKVEFATLAEVSLPPASIDFSNPFEPTLIPSTSTVGIEAVEPGPDGNVDNNTITRVPRTEDRDSLRVTNIEPTSGGERSEAPEISQDDVDAAAAGIEAALRADLGVQLEAGNGVADGATVFPETVTIGVPEYSVDPATLVGSTELEVELAATATGSVLAVDPSPIETIARARLEAGVDDGWRLDPDSIQLDLETPSAFGDVATYPFTIAGIQVRIVDEAALIESIRGLLVAEARTRIEAFGDAEITLWPDWVTTIPNNTERITLTLADPAPAPSATP